jgi:phosphatidylglycerophosphate synthase
MLDGLVRGVIDPPLDRGGRWLAARGASADIVTLTGLGLGLLSAVLIGFGSSGFFVLVLLLASRLADGLDGAVARVQGKSDFGGFLDIASDFAFYGAIPLAFVLRDPGANGLAGAFLLFSFYVNGSTFLAYAAIAARRGMETRSRGEKSLYFTAGLLEGTETIVFLAFLAVIPAAFVPLAWIFGGLCLVTAVARVVLASRTFR